MTLSTHIVVGAAAAKVFSTNPVQAFFVGMITHYILDSVAHWDYPLAAFSWNKEKPTETKISFTAALYTDIAKVLTDVALGFALVTFATSGFSVHNFWLLAAGAVGGVMPDFIQFLYGVWKNGVLRWLQKFHHSMHSKKDFNNRPIVGVPLQVVVMMLAGLVLWAPL